MSASAESENPEGYWDLHGDDAAPPAPSLRVGGTNPGEITLTYWPNLSGTTKREQTLPWSEFPTFIRQAGHRATKRECPLIKMGIYGDIRAESNEPGKLGSLRHNANVISISGIEGDYDAREISPAEALARLERHNLRALVVTTFSHTADNPRWRVLAPLSRPVPPEERLRYVEILNGVLGGILAPESATLSQSYYIGWPPGIEPQVLTTFDDPNAGVCLDEIDHGDELRHPFDAKTQPTPASKPDEGGPLAALLAGEDVHGNARHLIARMIARGEEDAVIRLLFQPIAEAVAATRGPERAADLMGGELDRLIRGARYKDFAPVAANAAWGEMEPLPLALAPVMPFDDELLPSALRPWIADIADRMQCPADYPAVAAMVALAAVVGRQVAIRPKAQDDWTVTPNLWGAVVGRPALLKTPAMQEPLRLIQSLESQAREEFERWDREHAADEMLREADAKEGKIKIARALKDGNRELAMGIALEATEVVPPPARRRYVTQDTTVEKLGELLRDNPRGVLVYRDELVGFLKTLDQEGREGARAFFLEAWNGTGSYTFDRIGRGTVEIEAACVSILGAIQPGPLKDYLVGAVAGGAGDDGLMQRFQLTVWPDTGRKWVNVDRWPDNQARQAAQAIFQRLDKLDPATLGARQGAGDPVPWLRFSPEAQAQFNRWREDLEFRIRADDLHPAMESHLAKYRSLVPSLALLAHLVDEPEAGCVGEVSLLRALAWSEYLETHAQRLYGPARAPEMYAACELAKHLHQLPEPFTAKEVYRKHWRGLDTEGTTKGIQVLIDYGHLRAVAPEERQVGRPTTRYEVHPDLRRAAP